ncbi:MAG TPA: hypothetical protein VF054_01475 [Micromonosporaceae bacterium]
MSRPTARRLPVSRATARRLVARRVGGALLAAALLTGLPAGCTADRRSVSPPTWRAVTLPVPAGSRAQVRDLAACPGHWYAVGATVAGDGTPSPAAWASPDGVRWRLLESRPVSAYGPRHVLSMAACAGDRLVAFGASAGGVHSNPRSGTWLAVGDGPLTEVPATFELFGGPDAVAVNRLAAGPGGFLIAGTRVDANRAAGAAVWSSPDGAAFRLDDADPALMSGASGQTEALDAAGLADGDWLVVGSVLPPGARLGARDPLGWTAGRDAHPWTAEAVAGTGDDEAMDRVVATDRGALAVGVAGASFAGWRWQDGRWTAAGRFGTVGGQIPAAVAGLAEVRTGDGRAVVAAVGDGTRYRLFVGSADGARWREQALPVRFAAGTGRTLSLAGQGGAILVAADDGTGARLWRADASGWRTASG